MTMHLDRGLTTLNTKKRKQKKLTNAQLEKLEIEWRQYNKDMRRKHMHSCQFEKFEDYVAYTRGQYKPKATKQEFRELKWDPPRRETRHIPSLDTIPTGACAPPERKKYTGDLIVGVATMHKSNAVPVMRGTSQAEDIAKMRRS